MQAPAEVQGFLAACPAQAQELALELRRLLLDTVPGIHETVDAPGKVIGYGLGTGYKGLICTIMPTKAGVNLGLAYGAELADPEHLLAGTGKVHRHVKLTCPADLERPAFRALLQAAVQACRARMG